SQLGAGMSVSGPRPGGNMFEEILHTQTWLSSFWGMLGPYPLPSLEIGSSRMLWARLISVFLTALSVLGCIRLFRNKQYGLLILLGILLLGYFHMAYLQSYAYGAYKLGLGTWWLLCFAVVLGAELLADILESYGHSHGNIYFLVTWSIVCVFTVHNLNHFDKMILTVRS